MNRARGARHGPGSPVGARRANRGPKPLKALGRYGHEAVVADPRRGHMYLTEDAYEPNGLFYRRVPPKGFEHGRGRLRTLAEPGEGVQRFFGATEDGRTCPVARNELNIGTAEEPEYSEFTGVLFSPDGRTPYANIQEPGDHAGDHRPLAAAPPLTGPRPGRAAPGTAPEPSPGPFVM